MSSGPALSDAASPWLDDCAAIVNALSVPAFAHSGGTILIANAALQRLLGYGLAELRAMRFYDWASRDTQAALQAHGQRCLASDEELPVLEVEAMTASGSSRALEVSARAVHGPAQTLVITTCQDLSDMRHVQHSLLEVGRVMHQIIENDPVATFVIDARRRVTHWNAACAQLTGQEAGAMLGRSDTWRAFYATPRPVLADLMLEGEAAVLGQGHYGSSLRRSTVVANAYEVEDFFPNFGEQGRWLFFTAAPLLDIRGEVVGAIETLQDVSQRRKAEDELKCHRSELEQMIAARTAELLISHHELDAFMENAPVGIILTARQQIVRSNKTFAELVELAEGESPVGMLTRRFFCSDEDYAALGRVAFPMLSQARSLVHEMQMCTAKGQVLWVQLIAYVSDPSDPTAGTWWLLQDRSEVRRVQRELELNYERIKQTNARLEDAQNQLLQSEKMASIGQLAAGVAHEINNPIGFVSSNLSSLRRYVGGMLGLLEAYGRLEREGASPALAGELTALKRAADLEFLEEDLPQLLDESEDGLNRVKKIVHDLKDFSRVDHADWQEADLNAGLESTLNVVMNEVKYKAEVERHYGPLPPVRCLAGQLNQVFMNLILNGAHAITQRGVLTLTTAHEGDWVWVEVADTGSGMAPEVQRRIFEPFFTTKPVGKGTGLGLSLSFSIVQKHGGRIDLQSEPGVGTRFKVWVPVAGPKPG